MAYDLSRMDPLLRILQKESYEEGLKEGIILVFLQQAAINIVARRFPGLKERAQEVFITVNDFQYLQELVPELSVLSQGEVDEILERLGKDQLQEETDL